MSANLEQARKLWLEKYGKLSGLELPARTTDEPFGEYANKLITEYQYLVDTHQGHVSTLRKLVQHLSDPIDVLSYTLTNGQKAAVDLISEWSRSFGNPYFLLQGYAGTGKTAAIATIVRQHMASTVLVTAPTNKATKVLRTLLPQYVCRTIYSALSLKMVEQEDELVLKAADERFSLKGYKLLIIDESSMLNSELLEYIESAVRRYRLKVLFVGDDAQIPPVGEAVSPVFGKSLTNSWPNYKLLEVVRHNNQILELATYIRNCILENIRLAHFDFHPEGDKCVWRLSGPGFIARIQKAAALGFKDCQAVAWRNRTVTMLNDIVRNELYTQSELYSGMWLPKDRIVFTETVNEDKQVKAATDDDGVVESMDISDDPETGFRTYFLNVRVEEEEDTLRIRVLHESSTSAFNRKLGELASEARKPNQHKIWKQFWDLKHRFVGIRHSYARTAHRIQGSTCRNVFVDAGDILSNQDRATAYRCLYVAASRPSHKLYITGLPK